MDDDNTLPQALRFHLRMLELIETALVVGTIEEDGWDPDVLGYMVFGGDSLLQQNPDLVADIIGPHLGGDGATEDDLAAIVRGMESRRYNDEFNRD